MTDVAVIGCGVVGAAVAYALAGYDLTVRVLEAENDVACGTTKANSGILHAGYDPEPGTLMARLNLEGNRLAGEICEKLDVPMRRTGSLVIALDPAQLDTLQELYRRGTANGVPGLRLLSGEEARQMEPALSESVCGALLAPSAGVVSPWEYALAMAENAVENGVQLQLNTRVEDIQKTEAGWKLITSQGEVEARYVINAAGVQAGQLHAMAAPPDFTTIPCRGEYYLLDKSQGNLVKHVIFQCPSKAGKGVLVAPTAHGNIIVGPNAEDLPQADTATTAQGLAEVAEKARLSLPGLDLRTSIRNFAGVRANTDQPDFVIRWAAEGFLDLAGMKSPGLTAAAAVGEYACQLLEQAGLAMQPRPRKVETRKKVRFRELSAEQKAQLVASRPAYGRVICRCETITEGEILAACDGPIPPCSIDGVKRRTNAGMGRCQGGFCGPRVLEILAKRLGRSPRDILQENAGSEILLEQTKQGRDVQ